MKGPLQRMIKRSPVRYWCLVFVLLNFVDFQHGFTNPDSRFATLRAMSRDATFRIDRYQNWTVDWSQTPDGRTYSNKAPGPMLIGYPIVWAMDRLWKPFQESSFWDSPPPLSYRAVICLLLQLLPFAWMVILSVEWLAEKGVSPEGQHFAALAMLFGNTASLFMNLFFGHGMAAWMLLGGALAILKNRPVLAGLAVGSAALSDYGTFFVLPAFALGCLLDPEVRARINGRWLARAGAGLLAPVAAWIWYHTICFGSPFWLPQKFQNPSFVDKPGSGAGRAWGVIDLFPRPSRLLALLVGTRRGILFTQPWMLLASGLALASGWRLRALSRSFLAWASLAGLGGLLWMNGSFNAWHGGWTAGPRYLCIVFPCVALYSGFLLDRASERWKKALWVALLFALCFRVLAYAHRAVVEFVPLWPYFLAQLTASTVSMMKGALFVGALFGVLAASRKRGLLWC